MSTDTTDLLATVAAGTAGVVGQPFLRSLARHLAYALDADAAFVSELADGDPGRARVVAAWPGGEDLPEGYEYALAGTACEAVPLEGFFVVPEGTAARFPGDGYAVAHAIEGYIGVALTGASGERVGYIGVQSRGRLEPSEEEVAALRIFAGRAAAELERRRHEAQLREREAEVMISRARVVQAADEERRRIGRDLHDGAQQRLIVLTQRIDLARRALRDDPERADRLLLEAREQTALANRELREYANGLHPGVLTSSGLAGAVRRLSAGSPVRLVIEQLPDRRLPDPIELTIYYLAAEAMANAGRHARASEVRLSVVLHGRELRVELADDGRGGADPERGSGLRGLAERVAGLGGRFTIDSPPGDGTRLRATIPLAPYRDHRTPVLEFGHEGDGGLGERLVGEVVAGRKTASIALLREWELEGGLPAIGQRVPVMDHSGRRRAEVEITQVAIAPFAAVTEDIVSAASAGARTLEEWRAAQRELYEECRDEVAVLLGEPGWRLADEEPMVITWFRLAP